MQRDANTELFHFLIRRRRRSDLHVNQMVTVIRARAFPDNPLEHIGDYHRCLVTGRMQSELPTELMRTFEHVIEVVRWTSPTA